MTWIGLRAAGLDGSAGNWKIVYVVRGIMTVSISSSVWLHHAWEDVALHSQAIRELEILPPGGLPDHYLGALVQVHDVEEILVRGTAAGVPQAYWQAGFAPGIYLDFVTRTLGIAANIAGSQGQPVPGSIFHARGFSDTVSSKEYLLTEFSQNPQRSDLTCRWEKL
jgi:hypothetical protein